MTSPHPQTKPQDDLCSGLSRSDPAMVRQALANGADPNGVSERGVFPLLSVYYSCRSGPRNPADTEVLSILLQGGADPAVPHGRMPILQDAISYSYGRFAEWFVSVLPDTTPQGQWLDDSLVELASWYNAEDPEDLDPMAIFPHLIRLGANVNARDGSGMTALMHAVSIVRGLQGRLVAPDTGIARALLQHGAQVDATDPEGRTALFHIARKDFVNLLREHGANLQARDAQDRTPLFTLQDPDSIYLLIQAGISPDHKDATGKTAVQVNTGRPKVVEALRWRPKPAPRKPATPRAMLQPSNPVWLWVRLTWKRLWQKVRKLWS